MTLRSFPWFWSPGDELFPNKIFIACEQAPKYASGVSGEDKNRARRFFFSPYTPGTWEPVHRLDIQNGLFALCVAFCIRQKFRNFVCYLGSSNVVRFDLNGFNIKIKLIQANKNMQTIKRDDTTNPYVASGLTRRISSTFSEAALAMALGYSHPMRIVENYVILK